MVRGTNELSSLFYGLLRRLVGSWCRKGPDSKAVVHKRLGRATVGSAGAAGTTAVIGSHVQLSVEEGQGFADPTVAKMLALYVDALPSPRFLALRSQYRGVEPLGDSSNIRWLRRKGTTGLSRVASLPWMAILIGQEVRRSRLLYARLPSAEARLACRIARILRRPYFVSIHGEPGELMRRQAQKGSRWVRLGKRGRAWWVERSIEDCCEWAVKVFAVSRNLRDKYGGGDARWSVVPHFMHDRREIPNTPSHNRQARDSRPRILFVGSLVEHKGLYTLLDAALYIRKVGALSELELVYCGDGPERERLEEAISERAGEMEPFSVKVAGWLRPGEELDASYRTGTVVVLPSLGGEGIPKALVEAMARGIPCIGSRSGGIPELLGHGMRGSVVEVGDPYSLAAAIVGACSDADWRERVSQAGLDYLREHDWGETRRLVHEMVEEIAGQYCGRLQGS